jgi:hypothetical protein
MAAHHLALALRETLCVALVVRKLRGELDLGVRCGGETPCHGNFGVISFDSHDLNPATKWNRLIGIPYGNEF